MSGGRIALNTSTLSRLSFGQETATSGFHLLLHVPRFQTLEFFRGQSDSYKHSLRLVLALSSHQYKSDYIIIHRRVLLASKHDANALGWACLIVESILDTRFGPAIARCARREPSPHRAWTGLVSGGHIRNTSTTPLVRICQQPTEDWVKLGVAQSQKLCCLNLHTSCGIFSLWLCVASFKPFPTTHSLTQLYHHTPALPPPRP